MSPYEADTVEFKAISALDSISYYRDKSIESKRPMPVSYSLLCMIKRILGLPN